MRAPDLPLYKRLLREGRAYWPHMAGLFFLKLVGIPLSLLQPLPLKILVDNVLGSKPLPGLLKSFVPGGIEQNATAMLLLPGAFFVAVALLDNGQQWLATVLRTYTYEKLVLDFRAKLFLHFQHLSLAYHDIKGSTDSVYRIQYDAVAIASAALDGVIPFLTSGLTILGIVYITARIDFQLVLVGLIVGPLMAWLGHAYKKRIRGPWHRSKELESSAMGVVQEALGALRVVKAFSAEMWERERFIRQSGKGVRLRIWIGVADGAFHLALGFLAAIGVGVTLFLGGMHVRSGRITLGDLLLVIFYLLQMFIPMQTIIRKIAELQTAMASAERAFSLLDAPQEVSERPDARPLVRARGAVTFRHISFRYDQSLVLHDVSFEISPGSSVGISGTTGAGKTTLINLMARLYEPTAGQILIDGVDVREYRLADLRGQFAVVPQDPVLFSATVAENIAYARPEASEEDIMAAARAANAHDFIVSLPAGYQTVLGERGMTLSGGERQRVALARAFLKNAPILVLDEPTSSVDVNTEATIMEAAERLMRGRTTFIIAHRTSTLENCDVLLKVERGQPLTVSQPTREVRQ